jgi:AcrR family transcriptional regulator
MARLPTITNEQILEAAREIFLAKGFGASTVEIAQRVGISEGSIFKRFSTKEKLFFAAIGIPERPVWMEKLETLPGKGDLRENLNTILLEIMEFHREVVPRLMMMHSRGTPPPELCKRQEPPPLRNLKALTTFLDRELELGRLRPCNPEVVARMLIGAFMNYIILEQMGAKTQIDSPTFVRELVKTLWEGISPT